MSGTSGTLATSIKSEPSSFSAGSKTANKTTAFAHYDVNKYFQVKQTEPVARQLTQKHGMQTLGKALPARRAGAATAGVTSENSTSSQQPEPNNVSVLSGPIGVSQSQDLLNQGWSNQSQQHPSAGLMHPIPNNTGPSSLEKKWSGGREGGDGNYSSSRFTQEFPTLDAAVEVHKGPPVNSSGGNIQGQGQRSQHPKSQDNQYGPGPALRPQTEGSWTQGGGRRPPNQSSTYPQDRHNLGGPVPPQMSLGQGGQVPAPMGYQMNFRPIGNQPLIYPNVGSGFYPGPGGGPGARFGMPIPLNAPPPTSQGQGLPNEGPLSARRGMGVQPRPSSHFTTKPIIRQEELERMDEIGTHDGDWASTSDDVDYNKKINFSDEEDHSQQQKKSSSASPTLSVGFSRDGRIDERERKPLKILDRAREEDRDRNRMEPGNRNMRDQEEDWRPNRHYDNERDRGSRRGRDDDWRSGSNRQFGEEMKSKKGPPPQNSRDSRPSDFSNKYSSNVPPRFRQQQQHNTQLPYNQNQQPQRQTPSPNSNSSKEHERDAPTMPYKILERKRGDSESIRESKDPTKEKRKFSTDHQDPRQKNKETKKNDDLGNKGGPKDVHRLPVPDSKALKKEDTEKRSVRSTISWAEEMDEDECLNDITETRKSHHKEPSPPVSHLKKEDRRDRIDSKRFIKQTKVADMQTIVKTESPQDKIPPLIPKEVITAKNEKEELPPESTKAEGISLEKLTELQPLPKKETPEREIDQNWKRSKSPENKRISNQQHVQQQQQNVQPQNAHQQQRGGLRGQGYGRPSDQNRNQSEQPKVGEGQTPTKPEPIEQIPQPLVSKEPVSSKPRDEFVGDGTTTEVPVKKKSFSEAGPPPKKGSNERENEAGYRKGHKSPPRNKRNINNQQQRGGSRSQQNYGPAASDRTSERDRSRGQGVKPTKSASETSMLGKTESPVDQQLAKEPVSIVEQSGQQDGSDTKKKLTNESSLLTTVSAPQKKITEGETDPGLGFRKGNKSPSGNRRITNANQQRSGSRLQGYGPPSDRSPFSSNSTKQEDEKLVKEKEKVLETNQHQNHHHPSRVAIPPPTSGPIPLMALGDISPPEMPLRRHNEFRDTRAPRFQRGSGGSGRGIGGGGDHRGGGIGSKHQTPSTRFRERDGKVTHRRSSDKIHETHPSTDQEPEGGSNNNAWAKPLRGGPNEEKSTGGKVLEPTKEMMNLSISGPVQSGGIGPPPPTSSSSGSGGVTQSGADLAGSKVPTMVFENTKMKMTSEGQGQGKGMPLKLTAEEPIPNSGPAPLSSFSSTMEKGIDIGKSLPLNFGNAPSPVKLDFGSTFGEEASRHTDSGKAGNSFLHQSSRVYAHISHQPMSPLQTDLSENLQAIRSIWDAPTPNLPSEQTTGSDDTSLNAHFGPDSFKTSDSGISGQPLGQASNGYGSGVPSSVSVIAKPNSSSSPTGGLRQMKTVQQSVMDSQQQQQSHGPISFSPFGYGMPQGAPFGGIGQVGIPSPPSIYGKPTTTIPTPLYQSFQHPEQSHVMSGNNRPHSQYGGFQNVQPGGGGAHYGSLYLQTFDNPYSSYGHATHSGPQSAPLGSVQLQGNNRISPSSMPLTSSAAGPVGGMMNSSSVGGNNAFKAVRSGNQNPNMSHPSVHHGPPPSQQYSQMTHHIPHHLAPIGPQKGPYSQPGLPPQTQPQLYIQFDPNQPSVMNMGQTYGGLRSGGGPPPSATPPMQSLSSSSYYGSSGGQGGVYPGPNSQTGNIQGLHVAVQPGSSTGPNPHYGMQFQPNLNMQGYSSQGPNSNVAGMNLGNSMVRPSHASRK